MPVRLDAAEYVYRYQAVGISTFTVRLTVQLHSDRGQHGIFWVVSDAIAQNAIAIAVGSINRRLQILRFVGGVMTRSESYTHSLEVGRIHRLAIVKNGTSYTLLCDGQIALEVTLSDSFTDVAYLIGNADYWADCSISRVRIWQAALSQSEIQAEDVSATPVRTANLYANYDFIASLTADTSGNSRTLTVGAGTPTLAGDDPIDTGSASITEDADTLTAAGTVTTPATGTANITEARDTVTAAGTVLVEGQASVTEARDTATAAGAVLVEGQGSVTEARDTVTATGDVSWPTIDGTANITEARDTTAATGTVLVEGQGSVTEVGDSLAAAGTVVSPPATGTGSITEAADSTEAAGIVKDPDTNGYITISAAVLWTVATRAQAPAVELAEQGSEVILYDSIV